MTLNVECSVLGINIGVLPQSVGVHHGNYTIGFDQFGFVPTAPSGFRFLGWALLPGSTTPDYVHGQLITITGAVSLFAVYVPI